MGTKFQLINFPASCYSNSDPSHRLNDTESALSTIRLLEQWHRKCLDCFKAHQSGPVIRSALETDWREASDRLLDVAFSGLEHQIDVVRHTAKEALLLNMKINILLHSNLILSSFLNFLYAGIRSVCD